MPTLSADLGEMAAIFQHWIDFNLEKRKAEGLESDDDTFVMTPTRWPTHGQLKLFIQTLQAAQVHAKQHGI